MRSPADSTLVPTGFVVLRAPALPFEWRDRPIDELLAIPSIREALLLASSAVDRALVAAGPRVEPGSKLARTIRRYLDRMTSRPTPFGLLASYTIGSVGPRTALTLAPRDACSPRLRLGLAAVEGWARSVGTSPRFRRAGRFRVNPGAFRRDDWWQVPLGLASSEGSEGEVAWVAVADPIATLLERFGEGTLAQWIARLRRLRPGWPARLAAAAIGRAVEVELLLPAIVTPVSSPDPVARVVAGTVTGRSDRSTLGRLAAAVAVLPATPGPRLARLRQLARRAERLPGQTGVRSPFDVDLARPGEVSLSQALLGEIAAAVEWLHRWNAAADGADPLAGFRRRFRARYGDTEIPFLQAIDEEAGVGLDLEEPTQDRRDPRFPPLLADLERCWREPGTLLSLAPSWIATLPESPGPLPAVLGVVGTLAARSAAAADRGQFWFRLIAATGPSGIEPLGRLSATDATLERLLKQQLAIEEAAEPESLFAEVIHHSAPRLTSIQRRARLRSYEIVGWGTASVPPARRISFRDLLVSVSAIDPRVRLRSARLNRWVEPRLSTAHEFRRDPCPAYRFLAMVQRQAGIRLVWDWGELASAPYLPRVVIGKVVVARARWRLTDGAPITAPATDTRSPGRPGGRRRLPRYLALAEAEGELVIDRDRAEDRERLLDRIAGAGEAVVEELFPAPPFLPVSGPDGRFLHDLVIPFHRRHQDAAFGSRPRGQPARPSPHPAKRGATPPAAPVPALFGIGTEWLSIHLHGGPIGLDRILRETTIATLESLERERVIDRWFFIRFRDPSPHLRLRLHGRPSVLLDEAGPRLVAGVSPWSRRGYLEAIRFEPYQPEVERYGGPEGLGLAERWFHQDSVLVGRWLAGDPPDDDALPRRAAVAAIDGLLGDWLVPAGHRTPLLDRLLHRLALDGPATSRLRREVGQLVRDRTGGREPRRAGGRAWRSAPLREIAAAFRALDRHGRLRVAIGSVIEDLVHLRLNRLLLGEAREDEALAIAGLRARYTSSRARRSAASRDSAEAVE